MKTVSFTFSYFHCVLVALIWKTFQGCCHQDPDESWSEGVPGNRLCGTEGVKCRWLSLILVVEVPGWEGILVIYCCVTEGPHIYQLTTVHVVYSVVSVGQ